MESSIFFSKYPPIQMALVFLGKFVGARRIVCYQSPEVKKELQLKTTRRDECERELEIEHTLYWRLSDPTS